MIFPRSTERGPIEAYVGVISAASASAFRVQQNAAPLKLGLDRLDTLGRYCLSAFNRTRPH